MEASEKRKLERERQTESRREEIIDAAVKEFVSAGIENTRITDIAIRAEVGPATVYRYFETKPKLVVECAIRFWNYEMMNLEPQIESARHYGKTGFDLVKELLDVVGALYEKSPDWLRLLEQFDNYIVRENVPREQLADYEHNVLSSQSVIIEAIKQGQEDGSIRPDVDGGSFCVTAVNAVIALSQKLLLRGNVVENDSELDAKTQIAMLVEMELRYLNADVTGGDDNGIRFGNDHLQRGRRTPQHSTFRERG